MKKKKIICCLLSLVVIFGIFSASEGKGVSSKKTPEDTFILGSTGDPKNMDSGSAAGQSAWTIFKALYDTLIYYDMESNTYNPSLAVSWEYKDKLTLEIKLRDDVYFHNGDRMTSKDVLYSFERLTKDFMFKSRIASIDFNKSAAPNDKTVILKLKYTDTSLIDNICDSVFSIVPRNYVEEIGDEAFGGAPVGTGAFSFVKWTRGDRVVLVRNENYWGKLPSYKNLIIRFIREDTTRQIELETGNVDAILGLSSKAMDTLPKVKGVNVCTVDGWEMMSFGMSDDKKWKELQDIKVRQAIAHAIDVDSLSKYIIGSAGIRAKSYLPSNIKLGYVDVGVYKYDPDLSKRLLKEAGCPNGFDLKIAVPNDGSELKIAESIQAYLDEVGIKLKVEAYDHPTAIGMAIKGLVPVGLVQCGAHANDPDQVFVVTKKGSGHGVAETHDPKLIKLFDDAAKEMDEAKRAKLYKDAQYYMYENVLQIPLVQGVYGFGLRDYVKDFVCYSPDGTPDLRYIRFK